MFKKSFTLLLFFSIALNSFAFGEEVAGEEILISNITIQGNNRVTNSTVLSYAEINIGDKFSPDLIKRIIKAPSNGKKIITDNKGQLVI